MSLFLCTFFTIYGSIHLYFFLKFRSAFAPLSSWFLLMVELLLILLLISPILIHLVEYYRQDWLAQLCAQIGYTWMGFLFLFFCVSLLGDVYHGAGYLVRWGSADRLILPFSGSRAAFLSCIAISLLIFAYGIFEGRHIRIEHLVVTSEKISPDTGRLRIVQISDLHLGIMTQAAEVTRIVQAIQVSQPDLLVSTGDLIDGQPDSFSRQLAPFRQIHPRFGKYAVTGNHEYYVGLDRAIEWTTWAGFHMLRDEQVKVADRLNIIGVDDHEARDNPLKPMKSNPFSVAGRPEPDRFTLFLKHRPLVNPTIAEAADLQLSGHTHRGQIFPFGLLTRFFFPYHSGYYHLGNDFRLYVSRGTGTWGPPIRFLAPPEITVIDLVPLKQGTLSTTEQKRT
jgi:predicted MPP superfamily phosphohydrolase